MIQQMRIDLWRLLGVIRSPVANGQKGTEMFHRHSKFMTGLLLATLLVTLSIVPAFAQQEAGQWMTVQDNESHWYSFRVGNVDNDEAQSYVSIGLYANPVGGGSFYVYGGGDWGMWDEPQEGDWLGASYTQDNGSTTWSGKLVPGTYFIRMEPLGAREVRLAVSGQGVHRFTSLDHSQGYDFIVDMQQPDFVVPPQAVAAQQSNNPTANPATFTVAQPQAQELHEPEMAMVPGRWMDVDVNEPMWFTFYVGHVQGEGTSHVSIGLFTDLHGGGEFQVFTAEKADPWNGGRRMVWRRRGRMEPAPFRGQVIWCQALIMFLPIRKEQGAVCSQ